MAQKAGLMSNLNPGNSKKDPKKRYAFKKFNHYFDEKTIRLWGEDPLLYVYRLNNILAII